MRDVLLGALGAVLLYPLIWYASAPVPTEVVTASGTTEGTLAGVAPEGRESALSVGASSRRGSFAPVGGSSRVALGSRTAAAVPAPAGSVDAAEPSLPRDPRLPSVARPSQPSEPSAVAPPPPALAELLSRVADVQQSAGDPTELAKRVQTLDADPAQLAQLRAFAEQFVHLPPSAAERFLPAAEHSRASPAPPSLPRR